MNEIKTIQSTQLPQTIEEKTKYVLFGMDALKIYRARLSAVMKKAGITSEQYKQLKLEAQETAENLLLFSADIGREMQKIEPAKGGASFHEATRDVNVKSKKETIHEMGFTDRQARDFQTLANHPDEVQKAIEEARQDDRIVTRQDVFDNVAAQFEDKRQREARELREAEKRHAEYNDKKTDGVVDFKEAKQDNADKRRIFEAVKDDIRKLEQHVRYFAIQMSLNKFKEQLSGGNNDELMKICEKLQEMMETMRTMQKEIKEEMDEK